MKTVEEVKDILLDEFDGIYCCDCDNFDGEQGCGKCHSMASDWMLSDDAAETIAERICE